MGVDPVSEVERRPSDHALLERAGAGDLVAAGDLYDRYGSSLYLLAIAVTGSRSAARAAVVDGFQVAVRSPIGPGEQPWQLLARATYDACPGAHGRGAQSRCVLAFTCFGALTDREAASTLEIEPEQAARYLREALRVGLDGVRP